MHRAPFRPFSRTLLFSQQLQPTSNSYFCLVLRRERSIHHGPRPQHSASSPLPAARASSYITAKTHTDLTHPCPPPPSPPPAPLSILSLSTILRSLCITTVSSSPRLLTPSLGVLSFFAHSKSAVLNPDRNAALRYVLASTVFPQFCAGPTPVEVGQCVQNLKDLGFAGVILGYAPEVVMDENEAHGVQSNKEQDHSKTMAEIEFWKKGTLATVDLADGGFVALKFTGAGKQALRHLLRKEPPSPELEKAIVEICERAKARNVPLLFDAEQQAVQPGIDDWAIEFQRRYNTKGRAVVYGTYQAYLKSTPATLSHHMSIAQAEGFVLGVKLVRGAYLGTEPRHLIWSSREETDRTYDGIAESLIKREYGDLLQPDAKTPTASFPEVNLVLASHNRASVQRAQALRNEQFRTGQPRIEMAYGQLYGMADDLSCDLVHDARYGDTSGAVEVPRVFKYVVWGTVAECMKYLVRRGQENKDAASRTKDTQRAMAKELKRRLLGGS